MSTPLLWGFRGVVLVSHFYCRHLKTALVYPPKENPDGNIGF